MAWMSIIFVSLAMVAFTCFLLAWLNRRLAQGRPLKWSALLYGVAGLALTWLAWCGPLSSMIEYWGLSAVPTRHRQNLFILVPGFIYGALFFYQHFVESLVPLKKWSRWIVIPSRAVVSILFICVAYSLYCIAMIMVTGSYYRGDFSEAFILLLPHGLMCGGIVALSNSLTYSWFSLRKTEARG